MEVVAVEASQGVASHVIGGGPRPETPYAGHTVPSRPATTCHVARAPWGARLTLAAPARDGRRPRRCRATQAACSSRATPVSTAPASELTLAECPRDALACDCRQTAWPRPATALCSRLWITDLWRCSVPFVVEPPLNESIENFDCDAEVSKVLDLGVYTNLKEVCF